MLLAFQVQMLFAFDRIVERSFSNSHRFEEVSQRCVGISASPESERGFVDCFVVIKFDSAAHKRTLPPLPRPFHLFVASDTKSVDLVFGRHYSVAPATELSCEEIK